MKQPKVSIIIVNWNGYRDTIECLESLKQINYRNYEIIIVDNGSKNKEAIQIKKYDPKINIIKNNKNLGFCKANNQGIKYALRNGANYVLLLNNDTIVKKDFLNILVLRAEKDKGLGILSPSIRYYKSDKIWSNGGRFIPALGLAIMIDKGKDYDKSRFKKPNFLTGCAMLIKKEVISDIGLLDENYFAYYEDVDYSFRVQKKDYSLAVVRNSIIWHKKSASAGIKGSNKLSGLQAHLQIRNTFYFINKFYQKNYFVKLSVLIIKPLITFLMLENKKDYKEILENIGYDQK